MVRIHNDTKIFAVLFSLSTVSFMLLVSRSIYSSTLNYWFLLWNLFLAWIPFFISVGIKVVKRKLIIIFTTFFWLLFFPNALYIVTDFIHLKVNHEMVPWFDIMMLFSFSISGIFLGFTSLRNIQTIWNKSFGKWWSRGLVAGSIILSGFGIYIGRFLRWNSWDILMNPFRLFYDISDRILHPHNHPRTVLVTMGFGAIYLLSYLLINLLREEEKGMKK